MQNPLVFLQRYLKAAATLPDAAQIGAVPLLAAILAAIIKVMGDLKVVPLSPEERVLLRAKDPSDQRQVSTAALHLLKRRPQLQTLSQVDPDTLQAFIDKDQGFDVLSATLTQSSQIVDDSLLLLRAAISTSTTQVCDYVRTAQRSPSTDPALARRLTAFFAAVDLNLSLATARKAQQAQRNRRKHQGQETR